MATDTSASYSATIEMPNAKCASLVATAVGVDPELRPDDVRRDLHADGSSLVIHVKAKDAKALRTSVTSLYDFIDVSLAALEQFSE